MKAVRAKPRRIARSAGGKKLPGSRTIPQNKTGVIVALDLASQTGVAIGAPCKAPETRTLNFTGSHAERHSQCLSEVLALIREFEPSLIVCEAPIKKPHDTVDRNMLLMGFITVTNVIALRHQVPTRSISTQEIDTHFIGGRVRGGRDARKAAICDKCNDLGWSYGTQDEADAIALWSCAAARANPDHAILLSPLFTKYSKRGNG